jgi:hypothetical protein
MSMLTRQFTVEASADAVWDLVGRRFDRIGDWATAIASSAAIAPTPSETAPTRSPAPTVVDAPVAGRVCQTGMRLLPQVTETVVAYDDAARTLTYQASGLPAFVAPPVTPGPSPRSTNGAPGSACTPSSTLAV